MTTQAKALQPLVTAPIARAFLDATPALPEPPARTVYRNRDKGLALNEAQYQALPATEQPDFKPRPCTPQFFYETAYGSPLVYVRLLDLAATHGMNSLKGLAIADFGFGTIGHLRLLALNGAHAHGIDVEPLLAALYSDPADTGPLAQGSTHIHIGRWPAEPAITAAIATAAPDGFDLITSKNTLKAGYIHPTPPPGKAADPKQLIDLGVSDHDFLTAVHNSLKPGGLFIIYNIGPTQSPAEDLTKPYIPWADSKSPFTREQLTAAGLEVLAFDTDDNAWVIDAFTALGYDNGMTKAEMATAYSTWFTITKRPAVPPP